MSNPSTGHHTVLYDGDCPFCVFQSKLITWMDWRQVTRLRPISDPEARELAPNVKREDLLEAMHCVTASGELHRGAYAIRFLCWRMPLMVPLAMLLWIPGVIWIAARVYAVVSRNRHRISRWFGCKDACTIMPHRERKGDGDLEVES